MTMDKCGVSRVANDHRVHMARKTEKKASLGIFLAILRWGRSFLALEVYAMTRGPELVEFVSFLCICLDLLNSDVSRLIMLGAAWDNSPLQAGNMWVAVGDGLRRANGYL